MGKSDPYVFSAYYDVLAEAGLNLPILYSAAFLGFQGDNAFTHVLGEGKRDFYDLALDNWEINSDWKLKQKYELIVCTRCAYFSNDPDAFLRKCYDHLEPRGYLLVDWGLGDHWRFEKYKVGWIRDGEHEWAYKEDNKLHSCFWNPRFEELPDVKSFQLSATTAGGYVDRNITDIIQDEVPNVISEPPPGLTIQKEKLLFLWPNSPQLYMIFLMRKSFTV